jgi:photosynthetic reaction center cytochrome c subunit
MFRTDNSGRKSFFFSPQSLNRGFAFAPHATVLLLFISLATLGTGSFSRGPRGSTLSTGSSDPVGSQQFPRHNTGAARCSFCHAGQVAGYADSAMAHSLRDPNHEPQGILNLPSGKITMSSSPSGNWQRLESGGEITDYRVDYVVGSGNHASGYLVNLGGHLFQSPVAYYRSRHSYDLAPGYENLPSPDFTRPVGEACVFCHSGSALNVSGTLNRYRSPIFAAESISCERCHGPVERHLADPRVGTIVNPAKLDPAARDSVCEQCHLFGVARVPNPGKNFGDFHPGQPLEDTFTVYHNAVPNGTASGTFKVISHVEQLALSACARNSAGRLWCGTCHDPHDKPRQVAQFYGSRCLSCHTSNFPVSPHPAKHSDCVSCHMPKRNAKDGGHTAFTDHRIQRRAQPQSDLPPDSGIVAWREPPPELQKRNLGIACIDAGVQRRSQSMIIQGYRALVEVQNQFSSDSELFSWIGQALLLGKQSIEAQAAFDRALHLTPNSPVNEGNSASARAQAGDIAGAITHLERAVALDPLYLPAAGPLIALYRKQGKEREAATLSAKIQAAMRPVLEPTTASAERPSTAIATPKAAEVFKNIEVLNGISADQLFPAMEFITSSLGVDCTFCHISGHFEKDDKKPKQVARSMIRMTSAVNKGSFDNQRVITCYSCHQGSSKPAPDPNVATTVPRGSGSGGSHPDAATLSRNLPSAAQVLDRYLQSVGGSSAIEAVTTRVEEGVVTSGENSVPIEIFSGDYGKQAMVRHYAKGDASTIFDGRNAWFTMPGRPARVLQGADLDAVALDADLRFPLHVQEIFPELRVEYPEKIGDAEAYVLVGVREGRPLVKLYFDEQSGLLIRTTCYAESPLGLNPTQIDYSDYRNVDGVQLPFRRSVAKPTSTSVTKFERIEQNIPIAASRFAVPPTNGPSRINP